ncbi:MAG TPA: acyl-CoA-binding protein [Salinimicrobium sp.]|nr:acyl-CoA-binding protein [Salinimicrobium sp.]
MKFEKAYELACQTDLKFAPDIMLHFYAYYKRATENNRFYTPTGDSDLRSAFKLNALLQVKNISSEEAKIRYIEMVEKYIGDI